jgi:hypothetical protein
MAKTRRRIPAGTTGDMGALERQLSRALAGGAGGELPGLGGAGPGEPGLTPSPLSTPMPGVAPGASRVLTTERPSPRRRPTRTLRPLG